MSDKVPSDWHRCRWGDLAELKYGKGLKGYKDAKGEYPVFGTNGPVGWCDKPLCEFPSVIVGRKGAYRGVHYSAKPFYVIDTAFFISPKVDMNLKWAYYALLMQDINSMDSGSAIPSTSRDDFYALSELVPPRAEQDRIVEYLDALNDKIELNRQMNETLEAMAQALFTSWFVDFDPVIDNALAAGNEIPEPLQARAAARQALGDQRKPLPPEIQSQFPRSFVFTDEMGWIPKGWDSVPVDKAIEVNPRLSLKKGDVAPFVDMKALPTSGFEISDVIKKEFSGGAKFSQGDVLFARITPCLENGKTGLVDFLEPGEVGFGSTEFIVLRGADSISSAFVACLSRLEVFRAHCQLGMVGSSGRQRVQNSSFGTFYLALPRSKDLLKVFNDLSEPNFKRISSNKGESKTLSGLRDTLLPKLLSGELRVTDAEQQIAEAL